MEYDLDSFSWCAMLGRIVNERLRKNGHGYVWGETLPVLQQANWRLMRMSAMIEVLFFMCIGICRGCVN